jgi:hypothetical protein
MVSAQRAHEVQLAGMIHAGHFGPIESGELDGEGSTAAAGAIDQDFLPGLYLPFKPDAVQSDHTRLWNGGSLFERQICRFVRQGPAMGDSVLGETAPIAGQLAEHLVADLEFGIIAAGSFDHAGDIRSEDAVTVRSQEPSGTRIQRCAHQTFPVRAVDGDSMNFDQDLVRDRGWFFQLDETKNLGRAVSAINNSFHVPDLR